MRKHSIAIAILALSACGRGHLEPRAPESCRVQGLVCVGDDQGVQQGQSDAWLDENYKRVAECTMQIERVAEPIPPGPVIRFVSGPFEVSGETRYGWTDFYTGQVTVDHWIWTSHEFVHYTLLRLGFDWSWNAEHKSEAFSKCA